VASPFTTFRALSLAILAVTLFSAIDVVYADAPFVVVSIRKYQEAGSSNIHLYLYGLDGKLKKQLTNSPGLDDEQPALDYDGQTVIFTRSASDPKFRDKAGRYILDIATGELHRLPQGMTHNYDEWSYDPRVSFESLNGDFNWPLNPREGPGASSISSSDGNYELISLPKVTAGDPGAPGQMFFLRLKEAAKGTPITDIPDFMPLEDVSYYEGFYSSNNSPFIIGPNFAGAFLSHHLGSTDGSQIWGLDLRAKKWFKMSENGGSLYYLPNANGIFLIADSRYEPLGKTSMPTVNCAYLEWWDSNFKMVRLSPPLSVFYGAAFYFGPGENAQIHEIWGS